LAMVYEILGQKNPALKYYKKIITRTGPLDLLDPGTIHRTAYAFWINNLPREADYYFDLQKKSCEDAIKLDRPYAQIGLAYYDLAAVYAFRSEKNKAYENLRLYNTKIGENETLGLVWYFNNDPLFNGIRNEPEFQSIKKEIEEKYMKIHDRFSKWLETQGIL
jgi:hypothetical protein